MRGIVTNPKHAFVPDQARVTRVTPGREFERLSQRALQRIEPAHRRACLAVVQSDDGHEPLSGLRQFDVSRFGKRAMNCIPAGMELWPSDPATSWEVIRRVVDCSDYYVLIIGGIYGSTNEDGISFTANSSINLWASSSTDGEVAMNSSEPNGGCRSHGQCSAMRLG